MSDGRRKRIEALFLKAIDMESPEREAFLDEECKDDPELRSELDALLLHDAAGDDFLEKSPIRLAKEGLKATDPERIGRYRIVERIGEGTFGVVYAAEQTKPIRRRVALKLLKAGMDTDSVLARFDAERQALALMDHPCIARVLDAGTSEFGRPFFVMELVKGESLTDYCDRHRLDINQRLELFAPICLAVQHAHQKGIIHRDLKPNNILVTLVDGKPVPKVIDFGIAKAMSSPLTDMTLHTISGQVMGTPAYMSPEQAERTGLDVDTTTDVYSLGVILYELLCGELPFDPKDYPDHGPERFGEVIRAAEAQKPSARLSEVTDRAVAIAQARGTDSWVLAGQIRGELDWIVARAMEKDRTRRYQTALALERDIQAKLNNEPVSASPPSTTYRMRKFVRRHRVAFGVAASIVLVLIGAGAVLTKALIESNRQRIQAEAARSESDAVTQFLTDMLSSVVPNEQGRHVTVKRVLDQAGPMLSMHFRDEPLVEARLRNTIGIAYRELGEFDHAGEHLERALEISTRTLGEMHKLTLDTQAELGLLQCERGDHALADSTLTLVLERRREAFGESSRSYMDSAYKLSTLYIRMERIGECVDLLESAMAESERVFGAEDLLTRQMASNLAIGYQQAERYEESEALYIENVRLDTKYYGPMHIETVSSQQNLGGLYREMGRYEEAVPLYEGSMRVMEEVLGDEHPVSLRFKSNLALLYSDMEDFEKAEPLSVQVVEMRDRILGPENPSAIVSRINLALLYVRMERWADGARVAEETSRIAGNALGKDHFYTMATDGVLGSAYLELGRAEEAEKILESVVERFATIFPPDHWRMGRAYIRHGKALTAVGRYEDAEKRLTEGFTALESTFGIDDKRTQDAVEFLIELYDEWGKPDKKANWVARRSETTS